MSTSASQPVPKNLRHQMVERVSTMDEQSLLRLHDLDLLAEKIRLREEISRQADAEQAAGTWENLTEVIRAYRMRNRAS